MFDIKEMYISCRLFSIGKGKGLVCDILMAIGEPVLESCTDSYKLREYDNCPRKLMTRLFAPGHIGSCDSLISEPRCMISRSLLRWLFAIFVVHTRDSLQWMLFPSSSSGTYAILLEEWQPWRVHHLSDVWTCTIYSTTLLLASYYSY